MRQRINRKLAAIAKPNGELRLYKKQTTKSSVKRPYIRIFGQMMEIAKFQIPMYEKEFDIQWM
jgi:hypothetical protein